LLWSSSTAPWPNRISPTPRRLGRSTASFPFAGLELREQLSRCNALAFAHEDANEIALDAARTPIVSIGAGRR
jgi:hypothetical protein